MVAAALLAGCSAPQIDPEELPDPDDPAYHASFDEPTDSRVSTTRGEEGGIMILWPRVIPAAGEEDVSAIASALQERMRAIAERALPSQPIDVRPQPQRACPSAGCLSLAFGAVLAHSSGNCVVVATIARPGETPTRLHRWSSGVTVRRPSVPFREPPESAVGVTDFLDCSDLDALLAEGDGPIEEALREAGRQE
jgi:hypothetical protein